MVSLRAMSNGEPLPVHLLSEKVKTSRMRQQDLENLNIFLL